MDTEDPRTAHPTPPQPRQQQEPPGLERKLDPPPDHGEKSYKGSGKLQGRAALITGADSGIGRAVAIAFAREGADVLISYLCEDEDARETARWVEQAGRRAVLMPGDVSDPARQKFPADYQRRYDGRMVQLGPHVRRSGRQLLRIYCYLDAVHRVVVVGHVGGHLGDSTV